MSVRPEHIEGGSCWCDDPGEREHALDRIYPDRCQIPFDLSTPAGNRRVCVLTAGHEGPCYGHLQRPGGPCHFCGATYTGDACAACWTDITEMPLADIKALFAEGAPELSIDPIIEPR